MKVATRKSWGKVKPIDQPKRLETELRFTEQDFLKLKCGIIPRDMDERWFIFFEDGFLYMHRSWTGFGIYKARIIEEAGVYWIREFWAERNQERFRNEDDEYDIARLRKLTEMVIRDYGNDTNCQTKLVPWKTFGEKKF